MLHSYDYSATECCSESHDLWAAWSETTTQGYSRYKPFSENRKSYGYRFEDGDIISINQAYKSYRQDITENLGRFKHHLSFDIAGYFNGVYHHDLAHWFSSSESVTDKDGEAFGKLFREINSGRSIDFLPHGLYPSKMIGSDFLRFTEQSGQLKSTKVLRFMDDYHLFDDDEENIKRDFIRIQKMLGDKGLNVNPQKTRKSLQNVQEKFLPYGKNFTKSWRSRLVRQYSDPR